MVASSTTSTRCRTGALPMAASTLARTSSGQGRLVENTTSAAVSTRASRTSASRTFWMTERSAAIAPTPIATQRKKKRRRPQAARSSRQTMRSVNTVSEPLRR